MLCIGDNSSGTGGGILGSIIRLELFITIGSSALIVLSIASQMRNSPMFGSINLSSDAIEGSFFCESSMRSTLEEPCEEAHIEVFFFVS